MACDDCVRNREMGHNFCTTCGAPLNRTPEQFDSNESVTEHAECIGPTPESQPGEGCPDCETSRALGRNFCTTCGRQLVDSVPSYDDRPPKSNGWWAVPVPSMVVLTIAIAFSMFCLFLFIGDVWRYVYNVDISIYVFFIVEFKFGTITGQLAQYYWLFIAVVLVTSSILILWFSKDTLKNIGSYDYRERVEKTPLYHLALFLGSALVIEVAITVIMQGLGVDVGTPSIMDEFTPTEYAFYMARAAVWEEIAFRLVPIGVPMLIIAALMRRKDCLKQVFGGSGMNRVAFILLVVSSIVFSYAHVDGWGAWKMVTVMISAFVMGYLFIRFGIYVSIVFHFITDYMTVWLQVSQVACGLIEFAILGLGVICIPLAIKKMVEGLGALKTAPVISFDRDHKESKKD